MPGPATGAQPGRAAGRFADIARRGVPYETLDDPAVAGGPPAPIPFHGEPGAIDPVMPLPAALREEVFGPMSTSVGDAALDHFLRPVCLPDAPAWLLARRGVPC